MASRPARLALWGAFFLSGAAALIYQVLWIRQLTVVVGATSYALAAVLGTFMGGLALGSALAGRWADRVRSPLRAYAALELGVAVWALLVPSLLTLARGLHHGIGVDAPPALELAAAVGLAAVALLPATTMMGATLPVLSRYVARSVEHRGRDLGLLYAVNTFGAFVGIVFTGFWAIEALGVSASNRVAVGLSVAAGAIAFGLSRGAKPERETEAEASDASGDVRLILAMAAASGFAGLAHEVVWNRLLSLVLLTTTHTYTTLLATIVVGIGLGSLLGAWMSDRARSPTRMFGLLQIGIGLSALAILPLLTLVVGAAPSVLQTHTLAFARSQEITILLCAGSILVPSILMGATYPPLARAITQAGAVGARVGQLYSLNTLGAVVGSVVAGFVLLPALGALGALEAIAALNLIVGLLATWPSGRRAPRSKLGVGLLVVAAGLLFSAGVSGVDLEDLYRVRLPPGSQILHLSEGRTSTVMVADHSDPAVRRIWIESAWVAGSGGSHRMLGHLPALHTEAPESAVGIAFGTGQSFAAALLHGLERIDCVDLDPGVVEAGSRFFAEENGELLSRPEAHLYIADGRSFLARTERDYDLIVMEPLQPWSAGAVNLYTREFYEDARGAMSANGAIAQWLPIHDVPPWVARSIIATFASVFPSVHVYLDGYDLCLIGSEGSLAPSLDRFGMVMQREAVGEDMRAHDFGDAQSVASALLLGPRDVAGYAEGAALLEDDRPFLEFVAPRVMSDNHFAANVEALAAACVEPLSAFADADTAPTGLADGTVARSIAAGIAALDGDDVGSSHNAYRAAFTAAPEVYRTRALYRAATVRLANGLIGIGRAEHAIQVYGRHLDEDASFGGAWLNLGVLLARRGDREPARRAFTRALADGATSTQARAALVELGE